MRRRITIAAFGLLLSIQAFGQVTLSEIHSDCQSDNVAKYAYTTGFISGVAFMANYVSRSALEKQAAWPKTGGEIVEAVCKYIDLHPETWAQEATVGVLQIVNAMYLPKTGNRTRAHN
jgi:hypothetical protein